MIRLIDYLYAMKLLPVQVTDAIESPINAVDHVAVVTYNITCLALYTSRGCCWWHGLLASAPTAVTCVRCGQLVPVIITLRSTVERWLSQSKYIVIRNEAAER